MLFSSVPGALPPDPTNWPSVYFTVLVLQNGSTTKSAIIDVSECTYSRNLYTWVGTRYSVQCVTNDLKRARFRSKSYSGRRPTIRMSIQFFIHFNFVDTLNRDHGLENSNAPEWLSRRTA